jgi:hypothetical protein
MDSAGVQMAEIFDHRLNSTKTGYKSAIGGSRLRRTPVQEQEHREFVQQTNEILKMANQIMPN